MGREVAEDYNQPPLLTRDGAPVRRSTRTAGLQRPDYGYEESKPRRRNPGERVISSPKKSKANYWITGITGAKQEAGKNYVQVEWWNDPDKEPLAKDWLEEAEVRNLGSTSNDMVDDYYKLASTAAENGDDLQNLPQAGDQTKPTLTADQPRQKTAYLATRRRDMIANADLTPSSVYDGINDCENCRMNHFRRFSDNFGREKSLANIYGSKPKNEWT